jgi:hypothetical protein
MMYPPILAPGTKSMTHMGIVDDWADVFNNISTCRYEDAVLGILCCILLLLLRVSFTNKPMWQNTPSLFYTRSTVLEFLNNLWGLGTE